MKKLKEDLRASENHESLFIQLKVHGYDRYVDCEYRWVNDAYHLFCLETKYGDVELDTKKLTIKNVDGGTIGIYNPIGINKLRKKYNLEHQEKVVISEKEFDVFNGVDL